MKKLIFILLAVHSFAAFSYTKGRVYKITLLHTNDHHGHFWPNRDGEFGLAARATLINKIRSEVEAQKGFTLLLDAGDVNTGVPQSDMLDAEPDFKGMRQLGYDVMALGNHEFDKPVSTIYKQQKWAGFPFISANIYDKETKERLFPSHIVKELDDLKFTIFGLTTEDTPIKSNPENSKGLTFVPAVDEASKLVPELRKESDVLVALTHMGHYKNETHGSDAPGDVTLARKVNGIDVIIGGHTAIPLFQPDIQNGTIIVQAQDWGRYLGRVDLEFLDGKLTLVNSQLIPINHKNSQTKIEQDPDIEAFLLPFKQLGDESLSVQLGSVDEELIGQSSVIRNQETNLGNLVTTAYKEKFSADLGFSNAGGIRASIPAGIITLETVLSVLPFGNEVGVSRMSGKELREYLNFVINKFPGGSNLGGFPQMSGAEIVVSKEDKKIKKFLLNGKEVQDEQSYTMVISKFLATSGGDGYPVINFTSFGFIDADILKEFVTKQKVIKASDYAPRNYLRIE